MGPGRMRRDRVLSAVEGLIAELRRIGVPIRVSEDIDAVAALRHVDLGQRSELKAALGACLVKDAQHMGAFGTVFDLYFPVGSTTGASPVPGGAGPDDPAPAGGPGRSPGNG